MVKELGWSIVFLGAEQNTPQRMHIPRVCGASQHSGWYYMQTMDWCINWDGTTGLLDNPIQFGIWYASFNISCSDCPEHYNWNCTKVYNCSSQEAEIRWLGLVAQALRIDCIWHNYISSINDTWSHLANLVWYNLFRIYYTFNVTHYVGWCDETDLPVGGQWWHTNMHCGC